MGVSAAENQHMTSRARPRRRTLAIATRFPSFSVFWSMGDVRAQLGPFLVHSRLLVRLRISLPIRLSMESIGNYTDTEQKETPGSA